MLSKDIKDKVLKLKDIDKVQLIELLCDTLEPPDSDIEKKWGRESDRRLKEYKEGKVKAISVESVIKSLRK